MSKRPLTGPEKASATRRAHYEDSLLKREAAAFTGWPESWKAALRVACPRVGCDAAPHEQCSGRVRERGGRPHAVRVLAGKEATS